MENETHQIAHQMSECHERIGKMAKMISDEKEKLRTLKIQLAKTCAHAFTRDPHTGSCYDQATYTCDKCGLGRIYCNYAILFTH